jgi:hypothetical protein
MESEKRFMMTNPASKPLLRQQGKALSEGP